MLHLLKQLRIALVLLILLTLLTGLVYPGIVTGLAKWWFPWQANGSIVLDQANHPIGSALIGQAFTSNKYFWGRPSATTPYPYNGASSAASNLGPSNPDLINAIKGRIANLRKENGTKTMVPLDLVTTSGSGLDPEISPLAAFYQVHRVAKARHLSDTKVEKLVKEHIQGRSLGFLGEPRVNVLKLNLALDKLDS